MIKLMEAKTINQVNDLVSENWDFLCENPSIFSLVKKTKHRIRRIERMKKLSWRLQMN